MADQSDHAQVYVEGLPITVSENSHPGYLDLNAATRADGQRSVAILLAAIGGQELTAGTYTIERDWPSTPNFDRLYVVGESIGCPGAGATVTIHAISWTDGTLSTLSLSIVCPVVGGGTAALELRLNAPGSIPAHSVSPEQLNFPKVIAGVETATRTLTLSSIGAAALTPTAVSIGGTDAADFSISSDTCTGTTLVQGQSCTIGILFDPADRASFSRGATVTVHDNTLNGYRTVRMLGTVKRPTTLTLESLHNPATNPDEPATITPVITPAPEGGIIRWYIDGVKSSFTLVGAADPALHWTRNGTTTISAVFEGTSDYAPSTSAAIVQVVRTQTSVTLTATESQTHGPGVYDVIATVHGTTTSSPGGTLAIWDDTTQTKLHEIVLNNRVYLDLYSLEFTGSHDLRATYTGVEPYLLGSTVSMTLDGPPPSAPRAPTAVTATADEGRATVTWGAPIATGGSAITGYTVTASPGGQTCMTTVTSCIVAGLDGGTGYTFTVTATNAIGTGPSSSPSNEVSPLPNVAPTTTTPTARVVTGASLVVGRVPLRVAWSGSDAGSGIEIFELAQSTDGGAWSLPVHVVSGPQTQPLAPGHTYQFRVRAIDRVGNVGEWAYGSTFRLSGISQSSGAVRYAGTWATSTSTIWWGGTARASSRAGSTASYTFTGRSIAWVGLKGVGRGKANVYVNGVYKATVDLYSATTKKQLIVWSANYATSATRTVTIKVLGTLGRPRVDVDGFIVGS